MKMIIRYSLVFVIFLLSFKSAMGQTSTSDVDEMSKTAANPIANIISFPFQNNMYTGIGPFDRTQNVLNIQPVLPLMEGRIITRTIFPVVWIPNPATEDEMWSTGLADILFTAFYVPPVSGNGIWGVGAALEIPSGGEKRGSQKWSIGPAVVALIQPGDWTLGLLANNIWSFAGNSDRAAVNKLLINLFIAYQLGDGWYVNSIPIIKADWKRDSGQQWTVPVGAGFGKLSFVGKLPVNIQVGAYKNVEKPDNGPDWEYRIQIQTFLPLSIFTGEN